MSDERYDYTVLRPIAGKFQERTAYQPGEGIMAQVVEDWDLVVGEDVEPARPNSMDMPAGNAARAEWVKYAAIQAVGTGSPSQAELDDMTRDEIRDLYIRPEPPAKPDKPAKTARPAESVKGD